MSTSTVNHFNVFKQALKFSVAASLLAYYLLPNTVYWHFSLGRYLDELQISSSLALGDFANIIETLLFCTVAVWTTSRNGIQLKATKNSFRQGFLPLWLLVALSFLPGVVTILVLHRDAELVRGICFIMMAVSTGLICAQLCGDANRLIFLICLLGLIQSIYAIYYQRIGLNVFFSGDIARAGGTYNHPNGVYTITLIGLPLAIAQAYSAMEKAKAFWMFCAATMLAALILTWFRGGILGVSVAILWLLARLTHDNRVVIGVSLCFALLFSFTMLHRSDDAVNMASSQRSIHGHLSSWQSGMVVFGENWLTGVGIGGPELPESTAKASMGTTNPTIQAEPKNLFLFGLDETGIIGGLLFVTFSSTIYKALCLRKDAPASLGLAAAWLGLFVAGMFDTPFGLETRPYGNVLVGAMLGATSLVSGRNSEN